MRTCLFIPVPCNAHLRTIRPAIPHAAFSLFGLPLRDGRPSVITARYVKLHRDMTLPRWGLRTGDLRAVGDRLGRNAQILLSKEIFGHEGWHEAEPVHAKTRASAGSKSIAMIAMQQAL